MAFKQNTASRNVVADAFADLFDGGKLQIRSGAAPGPNNSASGTLLAEVTLPTPALGAASSGATAKAGTWEDTSADATGTAAHFRLISADGTKIAEGTVTATGGGGDLTVDNVSFAAGQAFTITGFTITWGSST